MTDLTHDALVETMARAIYLRRYEHQGGVWEAVEPRYQRDVWGADARAALAAIREAAGLDAEWMHHAGSTLEIQACLVGAEGLPQKRDTLNVAAALLRALAGGDDAG